MPTASTLILFTSAALALAAMPGPGLFYIAGRTLAAGRRDGLASCLGSACGGLLHVLAGAIGVSALIMASATAFTVLKLAGGLYLIWLGVQTWRQAGSAEPAPPRAGGSRPDAWRALRQGAVVEATNPKTAAFVALQFAVLGLISIALNTGMAVLVVGAAAALRERLTGRTGLLRRLRRASGIVLGGLGVSLILARRPA
jgi:threonine/homoserine/homoserine lactone efflux protein